jgi:hypothetical protein
MTELILLLQADLDIQAAFEQRQFMVVNNLL